MLLLLLPAAVSCERDTVFHRFQRVPEKGWAAGDTLLFEIPVRDSVPDYVFYAEVRHSVRYPFRELFLAIDWTYRSAAGDSPVRHEIVRYPLADERGQWLGTGWGSLRVSAFPLRTLRFVRRGTLRCKVYHLMNGQPLQGIEDVGLRLAKRL
ncbi:MAG: gliding motility lipoprotein GldH [Bacteroidaceae bacterium]